MRGRLLPYSLLFIAILVTSTILLTRGFSVSALTFSAMASIPGWSSKVCCIPVCLGPRVLNHLDSLTCCQNLSLIHI